MGYLTEDAVTNQTQSQHYIQGQSCSLPLLYDLWVILQEMLNLAKAILSNQIPSIRNVLIYFLMNLLNGGKRLPPH